ncbi:hypothetical protein GCM10017691_19230 [Pseudonocardia petroleophila]
MTVAQRPVRDELDGSVQHRLRSDARTDELQHSPMATAEVHPHTGDHGDDGAKGDHVQWRLACGEI